MKQCSSDARSEGQPGHSPEKKYKELEGFRSTRALENQAGYPNALHLRFTSIRENRMSRFSLTHEPRSPRLGLRAFLFEDFPLRLKPVIKSASADALLVDLAGSR